MRSIEQLVDEVDPAIRLLRERAESANVRCEVLSPSAGREAVLLGVQVSTRSMLGALAYDTGGVLVDHGWVRWLGSGHPRLPRSLTTWNERRSAGFFLVGDDAVGGFFALNAGRLGPDLSSVHYWAPDSLVWDSLNVGLADLILAFLERDRLSRFYDKLRWPSWQDDVAALPGDRCFSFYPFLWAREGSLERSSRTDVPVHEAFDSKVELARLMVPP